MVFYLVFPLLIFAAQHVTFASFLEEIKWHAAELSRGVIALVNAALHALVVRLR